MYTSIFTDIMVALLILLGIKIVFFTFLSHCHFKKSHHKVKKETGHFVSIIIPCYNEERTVVNCIYSLLKQTYKHFEIILVDDGSTDGTRTTCKNLAHLYSPMVKFFSKENGGKASALNFGLEYSKGDIIVSMDADSMFLPNTLKQLVLSFNSPDIGAVGGNVKVANRDNFLGRHQAIEYIMGLTIQRRAFAYMNCMQVISGAIGAFRKDVLIEVGRYSSDTIVEDMDITISILKAGYRVEYNGNAIAYTEAPENIRDFLKQRCRWIFGGFQVLRKHRGMLFNKQYGMIGVLGLPYFLLFPWIDVLISFFFFYAIARVILFGTLVEFLGFYFFMMIIQSVMSFYALRMDGESKKFIWLTWTDSLWYNHLISFVTLTAGIKYLGKVTASWNKMERLGKNVIGTTARESELVFGVLTQERKTTLSKAAFSKIHSV